MQGSPLSRKLAVIFGFLGPSLVLLLTLIGGAKFPSYSHASQFISELGSTDAPHGQLVSWAGFFPAGLCATAFAFFAWRSLPRSGAATGGMLGLFLFALGYLVAAFFPCAGDCRSPHPGPAQAIHNFFGLAGYLAAPLSLGLLAWAARRWPAAGHLCALGFLAGVAAFAGLLFLSPEFQYVGVAQRVLEGSVLCWMVACAFYLRRETRGT